MSTYENIGIKFNKCTDAKYIAWLRSQPNGLTATLRRLIDQEIAAEDAQSTPPLDLAAIRRVFETVLDERQLAAVAPAQATPQRDVKAENKLDAMF